MKKIYVYLYLWKTVYTIINDFKTGFFNVCNTILKYFYNIFSEAEAPRCSWHLFISFEYTLYKEER